MGKLAVKPKNDIAFKKIFSDNIDILKAFLIDILKLENITKIELKPTEVTPSDPSEKFCRLDIRVTIDTTEIDIEMQVLNRKDFRERTLYYWAALFTHLKKGTNYTAIPKTILINIVDFNLFQGDDYFQSCFVPLERTRHTLLSEKQEIHFFELKKINSSTNKSDSALKWLKFISADTEEEISEIEKLDNEFLNNAVNEVKRLNKDEEFKKLVEAREVQLSEEQSALYAAKQDGIEMGVEMGAKQTALNIAKKLLVLNTPLPEIADITNLSEKEIQELI